MDNMDKPEELLPSAETVLPLTRIKSIMKSRGAGQVNNEALFVMAKSTELFVKYFALETLETSKKNGGTDMIKYEHVAQLVNNSKKLEFLQLFVPEKITVAEFKKIISDNDDTDDEEESGAEAKDSDSDQN